MADFKDSLVRLGFVEMERLIDKENSIPLGHRYAREIRLILASAPTEAVVATLKGFPVACILDGSGLPSNGRSQAIDTFRAALWNLNLPSILLVIDDEEVEALSVLMPGAKPERTSLAAAEQTQRWTARYLFSGAIWFDLPKWFDASLRVDARLRHSVSLLLAEMKRRTDLDEATIRHAFILVTVLRALEQIHAIGPSGWSWSEGGSLARLLEDGYRDGIEGLVSGLESRLGMSLRDEEAALNLWDLPLAAIDILADYVSQTMPGRSARIWALDFGACPAARLADVEMAFATEIGGRGGEGRRSQPATPEVVARMITHIVGPSEAGSDLIAVPASGAGSLATAAYLDVLEILRIRAGRPLRYAERIRVLESRVRVGGGASCSMDINAVALVLGSFLDLEQEELRHILSDPRPATSSRESSEGNDVASETAGSSTEGRVILLVDLSHADVPMAPVTGDEDRRGDWKRTRPAIASEIFALLDDLQPGAVAALLLPARFLMDTLSRDIRERLASGLSISKIVDISNVERIAFGGEDRRAILIVGMRHAERVLPADQQGSPIQFHVVTPSLSMILGDILPVGDGALIEPDTDFVEGDAMALRHVGSSHDVELVRRCEALGALGSLVGQNEDDAWLASPGWIGGRKHGPGDKPGVLRDLSFLHSKEAPLEAPVIGPKFSLQAFPARKHKEIAFAGHRRLFEEARVLWPEGAQVQTRIRAAFSMVPFTFQQTIKAIGGRNADADLLRFLAAYLRSPIAQYLLTLRCHAREGERTRLRISDILRLPFPRPHEHPDPASASQIVARIASTYARWEKLRTEAAEEISKRSAGGISRLVARFFMLNRRDRALIHELLTVIVPSMQPFSGQPHDLNLPLLRRASEAQMRRYLATLNEHLFRSMSALGPPGASLAVRHGTSITVTVGDKAPIILEKSLLAEAWLMREAERDAADILTFMISAQTDRPG